MTDFPTNPPLPLFISTWSRWGVLGEAATLGAVTFNSSLTWPVASTAFYIPIWIPWNYPVNRVFWANGNSVTTVNNDFGIYTATDGVQIYHTGSTAQVGVTSIQYVTPTSFTLAAGRYYFALSIDSTTANRGGQGNTAATTIHNALSGILQEASALPLPATMTPVTVANSCLPLCGVTRTTTGF